MIGKFFVAFLAVVVLMVTPVAAEYIISAPDLVGVPGSVVEVPIYLTRDATVGNCDLQITFDPTKLSITNDDVRPGLGLSTWTFMSNVVLEDNSIYLSAWGAPNGSNSLHNPSGEVILTASFSVLPTATGITPIGIVDAWNKGFTTQDGSIDIVVPEPSTVVSLIGLLMTAPALLWWRKRRAA